MADKSPENDNAPVAGHDDRLARQTPGGKPEAPPGKPCAMCGKPALMKYRPFCSKRCADLDLSRRLTASTPFLQRKPRRTTRRPKRAETALF